MRTSDLIQELQARGAAGITTRRPRSTSRSAPGLPPHRDSSPVEGELAEFIGWLGARHPEFTDAYQKALDTLIDEGYTTDIIQAWKNDEHEEQWRKLGVKPGIGRQLARNISKWGRERQVRRKRLLSPPRRFSARPYSARPQQGHIIPSGGETACEDETQDDNPGLYEQGDIHGGVDLSDPECFETQLETQRETQ
jgi:hypothetical protein